VDTRQAQAIRQLRRDDAARDEPRGRSIPERGRLGFRNVDGHEGLVVIAHGSSLLPLIAVFLTQKRGFAQVEIAFEATARLVP
jgi:hypothetical protein